MLDKDSSTSSCRVFKKYMLRTISRRYEVEQCVSDEDESQARSALQRAQHPDGNIIRKDITDIMIRTCSENV